MPSLSNNPRPEPYRIYDSRHKLSPVQFPEMVSEAGPRQLNSMQQALDQEKLAEAAQ